MELLRRDRVGKFQEFGFKTFLKSYDYMLFIVIEYFTT
jgi:hypothetical protein